MLLAGKLHRIGVSANGKRHKHDHPKVEVPQFILDKVSALVKEKEQDIRYRAGDKYALAQLIASMVSEVLYMKYFMQDTNIDRNRDLKLWELVRDDSNDIYQKRKFDKLIVPRFLGPIFESIRSRYINEYEPNTWHLHPERLVQFANYLEVTYYAAPPE